MERFSYKVRIEQAGQTDFRVLSAPMGDGYVQRAADGINARSDVWNLTARGIWSPDVDPQCVSGLGQNVKGISEFIDRHEGYKSFQWTAPDGVDAYWVCSAVSKLKESARLMSLTFTFTRTYVL